MTTKNSPRPPRDGFHIVFDRVIRAIRYGREIAKELRRLVDQGALLLLTVYLVVAITQMHGHVLIAPLASVLNLISPAIM